MSNHLPDQGCGACEVTCDVCALEAERDRLRAENERLRAAIEAHRAVEYADIPGDVDPSFLVALAGIDAHLYAALASDETGGTK